MNTPNQPQFLTLNGELSFRNNGFKTDRYKCKLNGAFVMAVEADCVRGYADVLVAVHKEPICAAQLLVNRLFGVVELVQAD